MESGYNELVQDCRAREIPMGTTLDMHPLDPPPPDVLLALLARNKALEGKNYFLLYLTMKNIIFEYLLLL